VGRKGSGLFEDNLPVLSQKGKAKLSQCLPKNYAMKTYGEVGV
jgi:hypothetical protein